MTSVNNHEELKLSQKKSKYITYSSERTHNEDFLFILSRLNFRRKKTLMKMLPTSKEKAVDGESNAIFLKENDLSTQNGNWSTFQNYCKGHGKPKILKFLWYMLSKEVRPVCCELCTAERNPHNQQFARSSDTKHSRNASRATYRTVSGLRHVTHCWYSNYELG
jgi:hypothetical protein